MVIGEAPGKQEISMRRPFVGPSGDEIRNILYRFANISFDDCYVSNVFKYPLEKPENKITGFEWGFARSGIRAEIIKAQPRVILALGAVAVHALLPELKGMSMECLNAMPHPFSVNTDSNIITVIPSYHPAASFRDSSKLQYLINSCKMVKLALRSTFEIQPIEYAKTCETSIRTHVERSHKVTGVDTETLKDGSPYIVSISSIEGKSSMAYIRQSADIRVIANHLARPDVTTLIHNALFDLPVLESMGIVPFKWIDTMTLAFMLQYLPLSLKELSYKLLCRKMRLYEDVIGDYADLSQVPDRESVEQYACLDPDATLQIFNIMWSQRYETLESILQRDMDVQPMVVEMMRRGIPVIRQHFQDLDEEFEAQNYFLGKKIEKIARSNGFNTPVKSGPNKGTYFNPRSGHQIADLLFEKLKLGKGKKIKRTASGRLSTSKKMTAKMTEEHPVVKMIDQYKATATLRSNFVQSLPKFIKADNRIHADIQMTRIPHSGRFAVARPNLLAIPVRSDDGRRIRDGFVAPDGYVFVSSDLNQIEMRMLAHYSQDPIMCEVYCTGGDIHTQTGMRIFGITDPKNLDDYKHRIPAKTTGFGIINLISAQGLSRELIANGAGDDWTEDRCQELLDSWFQVYKGVKRYLDELARFTLRTGYAEDLFGRREIIPQIYSSNKNTVEEGIRIAANQKIQSGAQGVMKEIMRNMWVKHFPRWVAKDLAYPELQIHDDLLALVREDCVGAYTTAIRYETENSVKLSIPVTAGIKCGKVWGQMKKV